MAILTINSGSSSLKLGFYADDGERLLLSGKAEEIGHHSSALTIAQPDGTEVVHEQKTFDSQQQALAALAKHLPQGPDDTVRAIGHRVVHGGPHLREHCLITAEVLATLEAAVHFAPLHIPPALALMRAAQSQFPGIPEFACFDTEFHTTMPPEAYTYALPESYRNAGVRRYGFHGLSYGSIVRLLGADLPERLIVAHLGSGSSLCAISQGKSIDTSMGLSPTGGVPMATRSGDLDPGVVLLLQRGLPPDLPPRAIDEVETLLNHQSGLQALANDSDMRTLTQRAKAGDAEASLAIQIFCRSVAKTIGSFAAVLGGADMLVFTGGIGEHSPEVRQQVCDSLLFLGIHLSSANTEAHSPATISTNDSQIEVRFMTTDEDGEIARQVAGMRIASAA